MTRTAAAGQASAELLLVCDGCLLPAAAPLHPVNTAAPCTDDRDCPPSTALKTALASGLWGKTLLPPGCRAGGACLLAPGLVGRLRLGPTPVLLAQDLYSERALRSLRAWPLTGTAESYAKAVANKTAALLRAATTGGPIGRPLRALGPSCGGGGGGNRTVSVVDQRAFFGTGVTATNSFNVSAAVTYADQLAALVSDPSGSTPYSAVDGCPGVDCNRACSPFGICSACGV